MQSERSGLPGPAELPVDLSKPKHTIEARSPRVNRQIPTSLPIPGGAVPRYAPYIVSPLLALRRSLSRSTVQAISSNPTTTHDVPNV